MKGDYILDGDLVLVRRQDSVGNGEIAVALLPDGTATLKRVYRERGQFRLEGKEYVVEDGQVCHFRFNVAK